MNGEAANRSCRKLTEDSRSRALLLRLFTCVQLALLGGRICSLSVDGGSLLEVKRCLQADPCGVMSNWKAGDEDPCSWRGVTCTAASRRVVALNISGRSYCQGLCPANACCREGAGCRLRGKLSGFIGNLTELRVLSLPSNAFFGEIPAEIGRLSLLEVVELRDNSFAGAVPRHLCKLPWLRTIDLGDNSLAGGIPGEFANCLRLQRLNLAGNLLNGSVPGTLGRLPELRVLSLSNNQLSGSIPGELARGCRSLEHLHLFGNLLTGVIPPQLGSCGRLQSILLSSNILEGRIPRELGRLSMLRSLDVSRNSLTGEIPEELSNCVSLSVVVLTNLLDLTPGQHKPAGDFYSPGVKRELNLFEGRLPAGLVALPGIQIIWAPAAGLSSPLPSNWGDCQSLQMLNLGKNSLRGQFPAGLGKCKNLFFLDLSSNRLQGSIPAELPVSCMLFFNVSANSLSGSIPSFVNPSCPKRRQPLFPANRLGRGLLDFSDVEEDLAVCYSTLLYCGTRSGSALDSVLSGNLLVSHDLSRNNFTGSVPPSLIGDTLLAEKPSYGLLLNNNELMGNISSGLFAACQGLEGFALNLSVNQISGEIPTHVLGNCKTLKQLEAAANQISGSIPTTLGNLESLTRLDLSTNNLQGSLPLQLGQLKNLQYLVLSRNKLTGEIPRELGQLSSLLMLDLSSNALTGGIPAELAKLTQLKNLFLDTNQLSGQIPEDLANLTSLLLINMSFNNLSGSIPQIGISKSCESFVGNRFLQHCSSRSSASASSPAGASLPLASFPGGRTTKSHGRLNSIEIAAITSASAIAFVLAVLALLLKFGRRCLARHPSRHLSGEKDVVTFKNIGVQLTYENIVRATGNFSVGNLIGNGGFGATYKAELTPGLLVAVKRLAVGRFQGIQQFHAEIRTLGRIHHQNLVTLIGYHASESEKFLVYNYLPGGNLESFIHERSNRNVDWCILYKIALHIAQALGYLHDSCVPRVLHRDIKPSNILLDNNLNAYLSDFGLARLLEASETHATTDVAGTFGYVAPEYAMTCRVSDKADVYSYGVVLLELLSGKKPLDPSFSSYGNGFNIVAWACMLLKAGRARELFTPGLWDAGPHDDLIASLHLAVMCTVDSLSIRPSMKHVVERLKQFQPSCLS